MDIVEFTVTFLDQLEVWQGGEVLEARNTKQ